MLTKREWFAGQALAGLAGKVLDVDNIVLAVGYANEICERLNCNPNDPAFGVGEEGEVSVVVVPDAARWRNEGGNCSDNLSYNDLRSDPSLTGSERVHIAQMAVGDFFVFKRYRLVRTA